MERLKIENEEETRKFGEALARGLSAGDVIALVGELGTGKTTLVKYIARELGVKEEVTSPTFILIREYKSGRLPLYHFDMYRISGWQEAHGLGAEEYFHGNGVSIVEWADRIPEIIPETSTVIRMFYGESEFERIYEIYRPEAAKS